MYRKTSKCLLNEAKSKPKHFKHLYWLKVFSDSHSHLLISITQLDKWLPLQALQKKTTLLVICQVWLKESFSRKSAPAVGPLALEDEHYNEPKVSQQYSWAVVTLTSQWRTNMEFITLLGHISCLSIINQAYFTLELPPYWLHYSHLIFY